MGKGERRSEHQVNYIYIHTAHICIVNVGFVKQFTLVAYALSLVLGNRVSVSKVLGNSRHLPAKKQLIG
jgi:hypothetical protein